MDYSLREYVEVLFLVPTMKIYLQGTPVWIFNCMCIMGTCYVQQILSAHHHYAIYQKPSKYSGFPIRLVHLFVV